MVTFSYLLYVINKNGAYVRRNDCVVREKRIKAYLEKLMNSDIELNDETRYIIKKFKMED